MMRREFTGRDMARVLIAGFSVVFAVNMLMATLASRSFSGVVVENSYVASQKFNGWLNQARAVDQLGWQAQVERASDGFLAVATQGVPSDASLSADIRRPLGEPETETVDFLVVAPGTFRSVVAIDDGRWIVRLTISSGEHTWVRESSVE